MTTHVFRKSVFYTSLMAAMSSASTFTVAAERLVLEEVIVTAQKRAENLQVSPVSVIAFSGDTLEAMNVQNTTQLAEITPNMSIQSDRPGASFPVIRGIGTLIKGPGIDQGVAMYLDGVQVDSSGANLLSVLDLQQVEVLKGPQGTLYGRNAVGGVINMTSRRPSEEFQGHVTGGLGNYDYWNIGAAVEGSLIENKLTGRISGLHQENDAYYKNTNPGFDDNGALENDTARLALVYTPTDKFEAVFSADYSDVEASGPAFQTVGISNGAAKAAILGDPSYAVPVYEETDGDNFKLSHNLDTLNDSRIYGASLTLKYALNDRIDLISITGYRETEQVLLEDLDSSPNDYLHVTSDTTFDNKTQEFRLHFTNEYLKGVAGLFYSNATNNNKFYVDAFAEFLTVAGGTAPTYTDRGNESTAWAFFTQWDWDITDKLTMIMGARWSESEKDIFREEYVFTEIDGLAEAAGLDRCFVLSPGLAPENQPACLTALVPPRISTVEEDGEWSHFSPKFSLQYRFNDDVMIYGGYSEGYRDGGFAGSAAQFGEFDEEILDAYEIGVKSDLMDGRLRVNASAFYYEYEDLQLQLTTLKDGLVFTQVFNAGEAEMTGAELELTWLASDMFRLGFNAGLLDTEITKLDQAEDRGFGFIREGNEFPQSPGLSASLVPEFNFSTGLGHIVWRTEINYTGDYYEDAENGAYAGSDAGTLTGVNIVDNDFVFDPSLVVTPDTLVDSEQYKSRTLVNTAVIFTNNEQNLELNFWARNLLDEEHRESRRYLGGVVMKQARYALPRTYGLNVKYRF